MVRNNIELDVKIKCLEGGLNQLQLGEAIGTTGQYVNRIIKKKDGILNDTFIKMMEALGYDIELTYVKKEQSSLSKYNELLQTSKLENEPKLNLDSLLN